MGAGEAGAQEKRGRRLDRDAGEAGKKRKEFGRKSAAGESGGVAGEVGEKRKEGVWVQEEEEG